MKKLFSTLAIAAAMLTAGCSQYTEELAGVNAGEQVTVEFTTALPAIASRVYSDGTTATTLTYAIYESGKTTVLIEGEETMSNLTATVSAQLVAGKTYDILFWAADATNTAYTLDTTAQTLSVNYDELVANNEGNDAFYHFEHGLKVNGAVAKAITLYRPFAQINLGTNDYAEAKTASLLVGKTSLKAELPATLYLNDGRVDNYEVVTLVEGDCPVVDVEDANLDKGTFPVAGYRYLGMNYVLAAKDKTTVDYTFYVYEQGSATALNPAILVASVPVQRNYRTNIYGSLLTEPAVFTVNIEHLYKDEVAGHPDYNVPFVKVMTVEEIAKAIENGARSIEVETAPEVPATIYLPAVSEAAANSDIAIILPETTSDVTFSYAEQTPSVEGTKNLANVNITAPSAENVIINLPDAHVTLNGQNYNNVTASVSSTTLVISAGVTVNNLEVLVGNAEIYGTVGTITLAKGCKIKAYEVKSDADMANAFTYNAEKVLIGTAEGLHALAAYAKLPKNTTVALTADIDLAGKEFAGIKAFNSGNPNTFDGQGFTVSNVTNTSGAADMGFIRSWVGPIKNVTIKDANFKTGTRSAILAANVYSDIDNCHIVGGSIENSGWACGAIAGLYCSGNITNCTVTGAKVKSNGGVGGIVGVINETAGARNITNCKVVNSNIVSTKAYGYVYNDAAIVGMANLDGNSVVTIDGCVVENCNISNICGWAEESALVKVDGEAFVFGNTALATALTNAVSGDIINLGEAEYTITNSAQGKNLTFNGVGEAAKTIINVNKDNVGPLAGSYTTFENVSINTDSVTYTGFTHSTNTYKNCILNGTFCLYNAVEKEVNVFESCEFNITGDLYNVWTWGASANFTDCTFNCDGKAALVYGYGISTVTFNNCVFNDNGEIGGKAAIETGNDYGATYTINVNGCTVNGFDVNSVSGSNVWGNKNSMTAENLNVYIDGTEVY